MEIEYKPEEEDLVALARHQVTTSPAIRRRLTRTHLGYAIGLSLLAVGVYVTVQNEVLSIGFAALATLTLLAYPSFFRWRLHQALPSLVRQRATPSSYAARKLRALPDGLEEITDESQSKVGWAMVTALHETADYAFLSVDGTYSVVIPRERISSAAYDNFMDAVRDYRGGGARQAP